MLFFFFFLALTSFFSPSALNDLAGPLAQKNSPIPLLRAYFGETFWRKPRTFLALKCHFPHFGKGLILARYFQRKRWKCLATWWPITLLALKCHFPHFGKGLILARLSEEIWESAWLPGSLAISLLPLKVSPKLSHCQNAESGISRPRNFLATFKVSRQNKPKVFARYKPDPFT